MNLHAHWGDFTYFILFVASISLVPESCIYKNYGEALKKNNESKNSDKTRKHIRGSFD